jgi:hypothetical protein
MKQSWTSRDVLPNRAALTLRGVATTDEGVVVEAEGPIIRTMPGLSATVSCTS